MTIIPTSLAYLTTIENSMNDLQVLGVILNYRALFASMVVAIFMITILYIYNILKRKLSASKEYRDKEYRAIIHQMELEREGTKGVFENLEDQMNRATKEKTFSFYTMKEGEYTKAAVIEMLKDELEEDKKKYDKEFEEWPL